MGNNKIRRCVVCGKEYEYCPRHVMNKNKPMFYFSFCSEDCKNIYDIASKFETGAITKYDAETELKKLDLSRLDYFGQSYKNSIKKIFETSKMPKKKNAELVKSKEETSTYNKMIEKSNLQEKIVSEDIVLEADADVE